MMLYDIALPDDTLVLPRVFFLFVVFIPMYMAIVGYYYNSFEPISMDILI